MYQKIMQIKRKSKGITLVSLIITVVIMLILAGVTISALTRGDGLFSRATEVTREYKKQSMLEAVDLAIAYVELDKSYTNEPIKITDVIDKIKEVSSINEKDYIITVDEEEQTATIIDKATGVVVDIWIDENGHIQSDGNIVEDTENLMKPTVTYELDPPAGTYGDEVKITITATEEKNGIVRIVLPDNSEITYNKEKEVTKEYIVTENGTYKFVVEGANGRKTIKYVEVKNIVSVTSIVMELENTNPTNQAVKVLIKYDENVKIGGQVLINADRFQYSIGENNWQTATKAETTIEVENNGIVYARYYNGAEGFKTTSITIQNIDKVKPTNVNIVSSNVDQTTFTLTATGADGESGIAKYEFYINNTLEKTVTTTAGTATYNVTGKTAGTNYTCKIIVYDKAGNSKESSDITVMTKSAIVDPETVAKIGDFVNYSVEVDSNGNGAIDEGETYDKWRILDFDNNGNMEIVCYNGPYFTMGGKDDYANAIKLLNDASVPYKNGNYGYSTRHLGSDPSNPRSYETIDESYIKFYEDYDNIEANANYKYIVQTHHESDLNAIESFSNTAEGKKLEGSYSWLASRLVSARSSSSYFGVRTVDSTGALSSNYLYYVMSGGGENTYRNSHALAPVVSLESGVKINTSLAGNGSEDSPWVLTK